MIYSDLLKQFFSDHLPLINEYNLDSLYSEAKFNFARTISNQNSDYHMIKECLKAIGINPLTYLTSIPEFYYYYDTSITSIVLPKQIEQIGSFAFEGCSNLTTVDASQSKLSDLRAYCFLDCENLTKVILPDTLTYIDNDIFEGTTSLKEVIYLGTKEQFNSIKKSLIWDRSFSLTIKCQDGDL